ncbi:hypothetical protein Pla175_32640 [Pirellulimonas nuda]|uniref:Autotransporter-associated beta strand repeat protein n=1 Tax=Pirellulimonas nuda TaxID=2528009 RepID=A0A518DEG3_9BACT|nr:hypothetical protein Pla175_32640 [Pirellulimonas nuda]
MLVLNRTLALFTLLALPLAPAHAINIFWDDAGGSASKLWSDFGNWSPDGSPSGDDVFVGVNTGGANVAAAQGDTTIVDQTFTVASLTIGNAADVETNGNELLVNGLTTVSGVGSFLDVQPRPNATQEGLDAEGIIVNSGATVRMQGESGSTGGGVIELESGLFEINSGGAAGGHGTIELVNSATVGRAMENSGRLFVSGRPSQFVGFSMPGTLTINNGVSGTGTVDLDGVSNNGYVDVDDEGTGLVFPLGTTSLTLNIEAPLHDPFNGTMDIGAGDAVNITNDWSLNFGGVINMNRGTSTLRGGLLGVSGTGTRISITQGIGVFENHLSFLDFNAAGYTDGVLAVATTEEATVQFDNFASFFDARALSISPSNTATIIVNNTVTVGSGTPESGEDFNWDGNGLSETVVNAGGQLNINVENIDTGSSDEFNGTLTMNSGRVDVQVADGSWEMAGQLNMSNASGAPTLSGDTISISGDVQVAGSGISVISSVVNMSGTPTVNVDAGATLRFTGASLSTNSVAFTGAGAIELDSDTTTFGTLTVDMPSGSFDLDGFTIDGGDRLLLGGILTLNVGAIDSNTDNTFNDDEIEIGGSGRLNVNLPGTDSWVMDGLLDLNGLGGGFTSFHLDGADVELRGTVDVTGNSSLSARVDVTGQVNVAAGSSINLNGGDFANPNTIAGGTISGPGRLGASSTDALVGFGTIGAEVQIIGNGRLLARGGTLNLTGPITDVGRLGTADSTGVLNVTNVWNTNAAQQVLLSGGTLQGASIVNGGAAGIGGHGLVTAAVRNDTLIESSGGTLIVQNNSTDWDGLASTGVLRANNSTLELRDNAAFLFNGAVEANSGTVFANGFELEFDPASNITLSKGTYQSTNATDFGGTMTVAAGAASRLRIGGTAVFEAGSSSTLNANLELDNLRTQVNVGALFSGGGELVNISGAVLTLVDGADVGVQVTNQGDMEIHTGASAGRADVNDFEQASTGRLVVDLFGTGIGDYDRLVASGLADLDGVLDVNVLGVLVPSLGDTFTILSAVGGRSGTFAVEDFSGAALGAGLAWDVLYNPSNVQLVVVNAPMALAGDYNDDGTVDAADYTVWRDNLGLAIALPNETVTAGMVTSEDYDAWKANFGAVGPALGAVASAGVPEPGALALCVLGMLAMSLGAKRSAARRGQRASAAPRARRLWFDRCPVRCARRRRTSPRTGCTAGRRRGPSSPRRTGRSGPCRSGWRCPNR